MSIEVMEKQLYDACLKGDVEMLEALMREDELILARVSISSCFNQTPLHLASMLGHFEFAKSLLSYKPDFESRLDSQGRSPLHLASANGFSNIVQLLLEYDSKMCRVSDEDGRTPLHLAVMNGQLESVSKLMKVNSYIQEGGALLHLCVMYNRLNVLILILQYFNDKDLLNFKDGNGNTILHSATALRRMQIIKYLVTSRSGLHVNAMNKNGDTALDIIEQMPKDAKTEEIKELLISAGTSRAKEIKEAATTSVLIPAGVGGGVDDSNSMVKMWKKVKNFTIFQEKVEKGDETLLLAATVIAAMSYQAAISPPGGVASVDAGTNYSSSAPSPAPLFGYRVLKPADSLLAIFYSELSNRFWICNTISFIASLTVIFLYVSGATLKRRLFIWLIRAIMWITLTSMTIAYISAVQATTPKHFKNTMKALALALVIWVGMIYISILVVLHRLSKKLPKLWKKNSRRHL